MLKELAPIKAKGHLIIRDAETKEILVEKDNAIHYENFSIALARSIAHRETGWIHEVHFGNGGATVSGSGVITYLPPNVVGQGASLYNPTYYKVIDDRSLLNTNPSKNFIVVNHETNKLYSDIQMTITLEYGEPGNQLSFDTDPSTEGLYVFDELGIRAYGATPGTGLLLTHVIFHPIQKALNREIEIIYTIRISMA